MSIFQNSQIFLKLLTVPMFHAIIYCKTLPIFQISIIRKIYIFNKIVLKTEKRLSFWELKILWRVKVEIAKRDTQLTKTCDCLRSIAASSVAVG